MELPVDEHGQWLVVSPSHQRGLRRTKWLGALTALLLAAVVAADFMQLGYSISEHLFSLTLLAFTLMVLQLAWTTFSQLVHTWRYWNEIEHLQALGDSDPSVQE